MKRKILERTAGVLSMGSLIYILGQAGRLENDTLSFEGFFIRGGIGIVALGISVLLINYLGKEEDSI